MNKTSQVTDPVQAPTTNAAQASLPEIDNLNGPMPKVVHVILETRCSTKKQEEGTSIARQIQNGKAVCERYGWALPDDQIIKSIGVSAWKKNRDGKAKRFSAGSQIASILEKAQKGLLPPNTLIMFDHPDRFGRTGVHETDSELWKFVEAGVMVYFISNGMLLRKGDKTNLLMKRIILLVAFDQAESSSNLTSDRIKRAMGFKLDQAAEGIPVNFNVFYPAWIKYYDDPPRIEFVPEKEKLIRRVLTMLVDEQMPPSRIAAILNTEGVTTMEKWLLVPRILSATCNVTGSNWDIHN